MKILSELREQIYQDLNEDSTGPFGSDEVDRRINDCINHLMRLVDFSELWLRKRVTIPYTTISSTSTGTTLNVTSASDMEVGMELFVYDGSYGEVVEISSITGTVVTLVSPGLTASYAAAGHICGRSFFAIPHKKIVYVKILPTSDQVGQGKKLDLRDWETFERYYPEINSKDIPTKYIVRETVHTVETKTLGASSDSVTAKWSETGSVDYTEWLLVNKTHVGASRIQSYSVAGGTATATLRKKIPSQVSTDAVQLIRQMKRVIVHPPVSESITLEYCVNPDGRYQLINGYDVLPFASDLYDHIVINYVVASFRELDNQENYEQWASKYVAGILWAIQEEARQVDGFKYSVEEDA